MTVLMIVEGFLLLKGNDGLIRVSLPIDQYKPQNHKLLGHSNLNQAIAQVQHINFKIK